VSCARGAQRESSFQAREENEVNEDLFNAFEALTFDDVLVVPGYTEVLPDQADVRAPIDAEHSSQYPNPFGRYSHQPRLSFCGAFGHHRPVAEFMTAQLLVTARVGIKLEEAKALLQKHRIEKLPLLDEAGILEGLITVKDIQKARQYLNATKGSRGRLLVGVAVAWAPISKSAFN
jgi:hypothetical protein